MLRTTSKFRGSILALSLVVVQPLSGNQPLWVSSLPSVKTGWQTP